MEQDRAPLVLADQHQLARTPLTSHEVVVSCIGATRTRTGLSIRAELDPGTYPTGVTVPDHVMKRLPLDAHEWHGTWNYTLRPEPLAPEPGTSRRSNEVRPLPLRRQAPSWLSHPSLTGMESPAWSELRHRYSRYLADYPPIMIPGKKTGPGIGSRYLSASDRLLVGVLKARWKVHNPPPAALLGTSQTLITNAVREANRILDPLGHSIPRGAITVTTADQLAAIAGHTLTPDEPAKSSK